jgi:hypothetical protein
MILTPSRSICSRRPAQFRSSGKQKVSPENCGAQERTPYFHHGRFTTLREAILRMLGKHCLPHCLQSLSASEQDAIEFQTLWLPPGARFPTLDETEIPPDRPGLQ